MRRRCRSKSAFNSSCSPEIAPVEGLSCSTKSTRSETAPTTPSSPVVRFRNTASRSRGTATIESPRSPTCTRAVTSRVAPLIWRSSPRWPSSTQMTASSRATPADAWLPSRNTTKQTATASTAAAVVQGPFGRHDLSQHNSSDHQRPGSRPYYRERWRQLPSLRSVALFVRARRSGNLPRRV